ncbi:MAG: limonene-1,2-epoxide hydrolase family protein, partial [Bdellovibrionota bacterium]
VIKGRRQIVGALKRMMGPVDELKLKCLFVAARDGAVLTERMDTIVMRGLRIDLPVMGTFEVKDGKVAAWRDYFDLLMILRALPSAVGEMLGKWSGR